MKNDEKNVSRKLTLKDSEAEAACPLDESVAGEEDPGAALEDWAERNKGEKSNRKQNQQTVEDHRDK